MSARISWDDQRVFLAVLEEGSFSAAARRLGLSQPTVRARIEGLEAALGTVLFTRSVNGLTPTGIARELLEPARRMGMAAEAFRRRASAGAAAAEGTVRLSVPEFMGVEVVPALLAPLRRSHPGLHVELVLSDLQADLLSQEVDLALRTVAPRQEALLARRVAAIPLGFFAARAYLDRRGVPATLDDLVRHDVIGPDRNRRDLALAAGLGAAFDPARLVLRTDSHPAQLAAARAGLGIAVTQVPVGRADPALVHLLPEVELARLETWVVTHENLARVARIRAVFDALVAGFSEMTRRAG